MNCIFCKEDSDISLSAEHIIPESLGNKSHVLESGIVCDKCNNYFARKIEKEVLELPYFKSLRHRNYILSKKNKLPSENAFVNYPSKGKIEIVQSFGNVLEVKVEDEEVFNLITEKKTDKFFVPILTLPPLDNLFFSRMIGKIALEALAQRVKQVDDWNKDFVGHEGLDNLRNYVRYGVGNFWIYNVRKVYQEIDTFQKKQINGISQQYQILHEFDFLYIENKYLYFVCIIMGVEYAINMAESRLSQYHEWLKSNNNISPLSEEWQQIKQSVI
jgi:hypothetical protein